jgi:conjugative relaxase-like TrwC/TraI family protein
MLRIHTSASSSSAKSYFRSSDYYSEGQELIGVWRGQGAAMLGLQGEIRQAEWERMCDNRNPVNNERLTARQKDNRRVGYDFVFDVPKSI